MMLIVCIIYPILLIIVIPITIYAFWKKQNDKLEIDNLIESELSNKTPAEIENFRRFMLDLSQDSSATEIERKNAKYALSYLNKRKLKGIK